MTDTSTRETRSRRLSRPSSWRRRLRARPDRLPALLLVVAAAVQSVVVLRLAHRSWFGVDAVYYLTTRGPVPSADEGLLKPYGGHWQTIPLLIYRGLFSVFGLQSYLPYVAVALAVHLAIVFVLYALLRSVGAHPWIAFGTSWLVLFFGAGSEAFMWDAPMVLTSGLLLGLVAMLVMVRRRFSLRSRLLGGVLLLAAVMCSGTGLVAAVTVGCFVLLRVGVRSAVVVGAPAVIAFSVWFFTIGRDGRVNVSGSRVTDIPAFVWQGLTGSLGSLVGIPGTGALLLLTLVAVLLWPFLEAVALRQLALAGMVGAVTQLSLSAFASLVGGTASARVGRYEYLVLVLLAASIALALETLRELGVRGRLGPGLRAALPVVGVLLLVATTLQGASQERRQADFGAANAALYRTWVYGSIMAADAGEKQLTQNAGTGFNGGPFELFAQPELQEEAAGRSVDARDAAERRVRVLRRRLGHRPGALPAHHDLGARAPADDPPRAGLPRPAHRRHRARHDRHPQRGRRRDRHHQQQHGGHHAAVPALRAVHPAHLVRGAGRRLRLDHGPGRHPPGGAQRQRTVLGLPRVTLRLSRGGPWAPTRRARTAARRPAWPASPGSGAPRRRAAASRAAAATA